MAQKVVDGTTRLPARPEHTNPSSSQTQPTLGMRGGLGKTLLIAFLLLAIIPLSLLALLVYNRIQLDAQQKLLASLDTMVALKEAHLMDWIEGYERELSLYARALDASQGALLAQGSQLDLDNLSVAVSGDASTLAGLILIDRATGDISSITDLEDAEIQAVLSLIESGERLNIAALPGRESPLVAVRYTQPNQQMVGLLPYKALQEIITGSDKLEEGLSAQLVTEDGLVVSAQGATHLVAGGVENLPEGIERALQGASGSGSYASLEGVPVFGVYRWNPELGVALLAEQLKTEALATANALTAVVIGATLVVALITTVIAAIVTRRITRPIVQLTETAAWMARGDLGQQVIISRKDEIGILARAFNRMASELRVLYASLEAKVDERTAQLQVATERTSYYAMQLSLSAEVARVATSIRDVDTLLDTVSRLIQDAFELRHVSVYLLEDGEEWTVWKAGDPSSTSLGLRESVDWNTLVGQVASDGKRRVALPASQDGEKVAQSVQGAASNGSVIQSDTGAAATECEMVVPLRVRERLLGVLDLQSERPGDFGENVEVVYQSLADQISISIENARAYAVERETVARLQELDRIQSEFLSNMSHALRTPLNSVIGFSRVMLKELDGPLTDLQRSDLTTIYDSGRQLLGLINDTLELTQLDLGTAPFTTGPVNLTEIIEGVMATARALARSKPIQLYEEISDDLPTLYTDGQRVRQVILALLTNAVKYTDEGDIRLRVSEADDHVVISVKDSGRGVPREELDHIFSDQRNLQEDNQDTPGFGLAISKRVVERLGGKIWVESQDRVGSAFNFTLPIQPIEPTPE